jgi:hypothetical protein
LENQAKLIIKPESKDRPVFGSDDFKTKSLGNFETC